MASVPTKEVVLEGIGRCVMNAVDADKAVAEGRAEYVEADDAPAKEEADEEMDYASMTKTQLQDLCEERELPTSGNKAELIARLEE